MARILLVEDEELIRLAFLAALEEAGHEVAEAANGSRALELLDEGGFDLVVTDVLLPRVNGLTIIRTVVSQFPETRVIAISGGSARLSASDNLEISESFGADAILSKPVSEQELRDTVDRVLAEPISRP